MVAAWTDLGDLADETDDAEYESDPAELVDAAGLLGELLARPAWQADAACREHPEVSWFPARGESLDAARAVCEGCLVRPECLGYALEVGEKYGVWGALSERQRRQLRRERRQAAS